MPYIMVDVESDGPIPGDYSIVCFGAVIVEKELNKTFYGKIKPISNKWIPEALQISGFTREQTLLFDDPMEIMKSFSAWIQDNSAGKPIFISDNNGYDWQFINWYFHHFMGKNPFGFSSQNLGSLFKGIQKDMSKSFKFLRKTVHSHNPTDDAIGNAEALLALVDNYGLKMNLK